MRPREHEPFLFLPSVETMDRELAESLRCPTHGPDPQADEPSSVKRRFQPQQQQDRSNH